MSSKKSADVDELLGGDAPAKGKAKKEEAKPAAKAAKGKKDAEVDDALAGKKPAAKKAAKAEEKPKRVKEPVVFEEGERDELIAKIKKMVKKPINSKDLAEKLEIPTRKLRRVLYAAQRQEIVSLELGSSPSAGMTVSPA